MIGLCVEMADDANLSSTILVSMDLTGAFKLTGKRPSVCGGYCREPADLAAEAEKVRTPFSQVSLRVAS